MTEKIQNTISIRIEPEVIAEFNARVEAKAHSRAALLRKFIKLYLEGKLDG